MNNDQTDDAAAAIDTAAIDAEEFAQGVAEMSDEQLREGMSGALREPALDEVFNRMERHFRPDAAHGADAVIHFRIGGRENGGYDEFEVVIEDRACTASRGLRSDDPRVSLELDAVDFMRLVTGNASGPTLFMTQRLKIKGDLMFAPRIVGLFSIPSTND